jgi:hypothetical protein
MTDESGEERRRAARKNLPVFERTNSSMEARNRGEQTEHNQGNHSNGKERNEGTEFNGVANWASAFVVPFGLLTVKHKVAALSRGEGGQTFRVHGFLEFANLKPDVDRRKNSLSEKRHRTKGNCDPRCFQERAQLRGNEKTVHD